MCTTYSFAEAPLQLIDIIMFVTYTSPFVPPFYDDRSKILKMITLGSLSHVTFTWSMFIYSFTKIDPKSMLCMSGSTQESRKLASHITRCAVLHLLHLILINHPPSHVLNSISFPTLILLSLI